MSDAEELPENPSEYIQANADRYADLADEDDELRPLIEAMLEEEGVTRD